MRKAAGTAIAILISAVGQAQLWEVFDLDNSLMPSTTVNALSKDGSGGIWIGTDWGLAHYDGEISWTVLQVSNSGLPDNTIRALATDLDGVLWVGMQSEGLASWDGSTWTQYTTNDSPLPENEIRDLFVDHRNWVWITTSGGLAVFTGTEWSIYNNTDESHAGLVLNTSSTNCVAVRSDGLVCLGTINGGLHFISETNVFFLNIPNDGFFDNTATDVLFDPITGDRWVSTPSAGLLRQQGPAFGGAWFQWSTAIGFPSNGLSSVTMDPAGRIWTGAQAAGVIRLDNAGGQQHFTMQNSGLPDNEVRSVLAADDGSIWIGTTYGGLARYREFVGVRSPGPFFSIRVFPNPTSTNSVVELSGASGPWTWVLRDPQGRAMDAGSSKGNRAELPMLDKASGVYLLTVIQGGFQEQLRVVRP